MRKHEVAIQQFMRLRILNYFERHNVDFCLQIDLTGSRTVDLLLQPEISKETGYVDAITSTYSADDSWIINTEFTKEIQDAMDVLLDEYGEEFKIN